MTGRAVLAITTVAALVLASAPAASARGISCAGVIGGGTQLTTIRGDLTVSENASCTLDFVNVTGNVHVLPGARLVVRAYDEPSTIEGNVKADRCDSVLLEGIVTVGGNLEIHDCRGAGPNGFQGPDTVIRGNFDCHDNSGACQAWLGEVDGHVLVHNNASTVPSEISLTAVGGNLSCHNNAPAPTHTHGPNWVSGHVEGDGQCAGFSTTTTSIATPVTPVASCAALASLPAAAFPVPNTVITSATDTPASGTLPERCIVNGVHQSARQPRGPLRLPGRVSGAAAACRQLEPRLPVPGRRRD